MRIYDDQNLYILKSTLFWVGLMTVNWMFSGILFVRSIALNQPNSIQIYNVFVSSHWSFVSEFLFPPFKHGYDQQ